MPKRKPRFGAVAPPVYAGARIVTEEASTPTVSAQQRPANIWISHRLQPQRGHAPVQPHGHQPASTALLRPLTGGPLLHPPTPDSDFKLLHLVIPIASSVWLKETRKYLLHIQNGPDPSPVKAISQLKAIFRVRSLVEQRRHAARHPGSSGADSCTEQVCWATTRPHPHARASLAVGGSRGVVKEARTSTRRTIDTCLWNKLSAATLFCR